MIYACVYFFPSIWHEWYVSVSISDAPFYMNDTCVSIFDALFDTIDICMCLFLMPVLTWMRHVCVYIGCPAEHEWNLFVYSDAPFDMNMCLFRYTFWHEQHICVYLSIEVEIDMKNKCLSVFLSDGTMAPTMYVCDGARKCVC